MLDGFARTTKWNFTGDSTDIALVTSQMVKTKSYEESTKMNDIAPYLYLSQTKPEFNTLQTMWQFYHGSDNTNININKYGNDYILNGEVWEIYKFNIHNLSDISKVFPEKPKFVLKKLLKYSSLSSSHPLPEYGTNNMIDFYTHMSLFGGADIHIARMSSAKHREFLATVHHHSYPYMHSFGATKNYVIL